MKKIFSQQLIDVITGILFLGKPPFDCHFFNICIDWSSLGNAVLEKSNDQGLIFTFKAEIKRYLSIDWQTSIIVRTCTLVTQLKTLARAA